MTVEIDQEYAVVPIDDVQEHPQNPNRGNEDAIDESIEVNGWFGACIVQKSTGFILAGNHRHRVAKKKGAEEIPVIYRDVDDETALRIMLGDNQIAALAEIDEEALAAILDGLESLDGTGYGFDKAEAKLEADADAVPPQRAGGGVGGNGVPDTVTGHVDPDSGEYIIDGDVPKDKYNPQFGVMVVCDSERQQHDLYDFMVGLQESDPEVFENTELRVVAV